MERIDFKQIILDAYFNTPCPEENKKILSEIVEAEDRLLAILNEEQKSMYIKIDCLKDELDVLTSNQIVDFFLSAFKSIFS